MFNRIIVPVDGSDASWRTTSIGDHLAATCHAELELVYVGWHESDPTPVRVEARIAEAAWTGAAPSLNFLLTQESVATAIAKRLTSVNDAMLVMASTGRGRSEAVLGSVMSEVLTLTYGPLVVGGPKVDVERSFAASELVVTVDGSDLSEAALGLAGAWGIGMQLRPWVVSVVAPESGVDDAAVESNYVSATARDLAARTGRETEFEVLHGDRPAARIVDFADSIRARFIVMATHGRGGLARLTLGSVAADVVREARCPVVLMRPPALLVHAHSDA